MKLVYHRASSGDLEILTETRIRVLKAANGLGDSVDMEEIRRESRRYYQKSFGENTHTAYLVYDGNTVIGAGGVSFYQVMPTYCNPTGMKAYIMNMYTLEGYRRNGIGRTVLDLLIREARERGISYISLEATKLGRTLYESYGFVDMGHEMWLPA